ARKLRRSPEPRGITYAELAAAVSATHPTHQRSPKLHAALTEVSRACRRAHLPCLPALVWRAGVGRPGAGYYAVAHPRALSDAARAAAWERERARVFAEAARYPRTLGGANGGAP
ncbi:MAG: hypothetical protein KIT31_29870, partial [Deltaproteobacteria bacterium]|nr:hypothetical protein [Deltaproteobacteria bacterium]